MAHFFSCDWGTSSFRLRRVNAADGCIVAERRDATGVKALHAQCPPGDAVAREKVFADFLRAQLLALVDGQAADLSGATVVVSGMASSSIGWRELPYAKTPVGLDGANMRREDFALDLGGGAEARVRLLSGVRTETEIMRGEETEILGLFARGQYADVAENGLVILPGTHSKHVRLQKRQMTDFSTYMTGELFDVLAAYSILRASVGEAGTGTPSNLNETAARASFTEGVRTANERGLPRSLFQTRTRTVLLGATTTMSRWYLSGLLIGAEIAALSDGEHDFPLLLAAPAPLHEAYLLALTTLDLQSRLQTVPPAEMALASVRGHLMLRPSR